MSFIQFMSTCSMIPSMINKHVLLRIFWPYFPHYLFGCIHMIGVFRLYLVLLLVCEFEGISQLHICMYIIFKRGKSCILGVLIIGSCTHVVLNSNNECTFVTLYNFPCMLIFKASIWIKLHIILHLWFWLGTLKLLNAHFNPNYFIWVPI